MPFVIFTAPYFTDIAVRFLESLARLPDVKLGVLSAEPFEKLPRHLLGGIAAYLKIDDVSSTAELVRGAEALSKYAREPIHRLFGAVELIQVPLAEARERLGIPGMSSEVAKNFRDKGRMKTVLAAAGVPRARHATARSEEEVVAFAASTGYPVVVKPPDGAGAESTFRADGEADLRARLQKVRPSPEAPVVVEEFVVGDEHSFETISIGGKHVWHSLTHYRPTPLEVLQNPWIQWSVVLPREIDEPRYDDIRAAGYKALDALGMDTGLSHMEWFRRKDGSVAISEVGARPPGAQITTLVAEAHELDFVYAWARVMVHGDFDPPKRKFAVGIAYLRGQGTGSVRALHGVEAVEKEIGYLVTKSKLPVVGHAKSKSYEGDGYMIVRHERTDVVEEAVKKIISTVRVECA